MDYSMNKTNKLIIGIFIIFLLFVCLNNVSATDYSDNVSDNNGNDGVILQLILL